MTPALATLLEGNSVAVVVGASGGVGRAITERLIAESPVGKVFSTSRALRQASASREHPGVLDLTDEDSISAAAAAASALGEIRLVVVASGVLHEAGKLSPEKSWRALDAAPLEHYMRVNAIGPALVAKHFLPHFPRRGRAVFAALSARVGSISDNRLGGWYGYRASKAALNMLLRTLALELARRAPEAVCVGLHPGTVDTGLSRPFQSAVAEGRLFSAMQSAGHLLQVIGNLTPPDTGKLFAWDGTEIAP